MDILVSFFFGSILACITYILLNRLYTIRKLLAIEVKDNSNKMSVMTYPDRDNIYNIEYKLTATAVRRDKRKILSYTLHINKPLNYKVISNFVEIFHEGEGMTSIILEKM